MSDRAREYVKWLDLPWHLKSFLFLVADYDNEKKGCFPGLATLAAVMGKGDPRNVRRLLKDPQLAGVIRYEPGCGQGNKGSFHFVGLETAVQESLFEANGVAKGVRKGVTNGVKTDSAIRKNQEPRTRNQGQEHHSFAALNDFPPDQDEKAALNAAIRIWINVKQQLKTKLPIEDWNLWVRPMFLYRLMADGLLFSIPPNGRIVKAARANQNVLVEFLRPHGYVGCSFTPYPDEYQLDRLSHEYPEFYEQLPEALKKRRPEKVSA